MLESSLPKHLLMQARREEEKTSQDWLAWMSYRNAVTFFGRSCLAVGRVIAETAKKTFSQAKFVRSANGRTLLPANSVTTIMTTGGPTSSDDPVMVQHLVYNEHLPRGVTVVDTLTCKKNGLYPIHVANLGQADVWLNKGVWVGVIKEGYVICDSVTPA